jgi:hypothetical protein
MLAVRHLSSRQHHQQPPGLISSHNPNSTCTCSVVHGTYVHTDDVDGGSNGGVVKDVRRDVPAGVVSNDSCAGEAPLIQRRAEDVDVVRGVPTLVPDADCTVMGVHETSRQTPKLETTTYATAEENLMQSHVRGAYRSRCAGRTWSWHRRPTWPRSQQSERSSCTGCCPLSRRPPLRHTANRHLFAKPTQGHTTRMIRGVVTASAPTGMKCVSRLVRDESDR